MRGEDAAEQLVRRLRERQDALTHDIARGNVPPTNAEGGYWQMTGRILELDFAIALAREVLLGERTEETANTIRDLYGA